MKKMQWVVLILAILSILSIVSSAIVNSQDMNSRFGDGNLKQATVTATTMTATAMTATAMTATTGTFTNFIMGGQTVVAARYIGKPAGGAGDSIAVTGVKRHDMVIAILNRKVSAADSNLVLWNAIPAIPTTGKVYLKFSKVPTDTVQVSIYTIQY